MRFAAVPGPPRKPLALLRVRAGFAAVPGIPRANCWQEPVFPQCSNCPVRSAVRWGRLRLRSRLCYGLPPRQPRAGVKSNELAWLFRAPGGAKCHRCSCSCTGCVSISADRPVGRRRAESERAAATCGVPVTNRPTAIGGRTPIGLQSSSFAIVRMAELRGTMPRSPSCQF